MSSKSKKKTSGSPVDAEAPVKKKKAPKNYIARPSAGNKTICTLHMHPEAMEILELRNNDFVHVSLSEAPGLGVLATVFSDASILETNVVGVSPELRRLGAILLGDRLSIVKYNQQPPYADSVSVNIPEDADENEFSSKVEKELANIGLVSPGLGFGINSINFHIVDIANALETSMNDLSLSDSQESSAFVTPTFIFAKGKTKLTFSKDCIDTSKYPNYHAPQSFNSIGGLTKQIAVLQSTIEVPLHNPQLFSDFGISPPRGVLLHGPPGTGKTMLLRCVAQNVNAHVLSINGPSIVSKYLGETENAIRDIFQEARKYQPSIIFMDEIDSLVPSRNSDDSGETESRVVATMLTMMDGVNDTGRVVVIGATNRPNSIDPALRRPGRFDQEIEVSIPDADDRFDILKKLVGKIKANKKTLSEDEIRDISSKTHGYVGADLSALCREGVMKAIARGLKNSIPQSQIQITFQDMLEALPDIRPSAMREIFLEMPKVYWSDIGGQQELKRKLVEVVQLPLEAAESFNNLGVQAPKGVLLYGPPGCSKTLTAKALATESGLNFLAVKGPEIFNKYVGESERAIREIFRKARAASPSIIFFDEIDAISGDRESGGTSASQHVLTSLLNEIDGIEELKGVVIVAATNRPTEIDPALLRPGRLDRHIYVGPPDSEARLQIIQNCCKKFKVDENEVSFEKLVSATEGCSGAEVALLCQESGLAAIMEDKTATSVHLRHFEHALKGIPRGITPEMLEYYDEFASRSGLGV